MHKEGPQKVNSSKKDYDMLMHYHYHGTTSKDDTICFHRSEQILQTLDNTFNNKEVS